MKNREIEHYLSDFDNLKETGHFGDVPIKEYVFHHKEMNIKSFICKGREIIRLLFMERKQDRLSMIQSYYSKIQLNNLSLDDVLDLMEKDMKFLKDQNKGLTPTSK